MKKRILFVDNEPLVLQGLQRMLRPMLQEWEIDFAEGGAEALERIATVTYDVVVSEMVMPGMDGAQLLTEIRQRAPNTIRLILSGDLERKYPAKWEGVAHLYLSKPCDPKTLKNTLARAISLDSTQSASFSKFLPRLEQLSIPPLRSEFVCRLLAPEVCMEAVML